MNLDQILQLQLRPGITDLGWGHPDLTKLPVAAIQRAASTALERYGGVMLTYGIDRGVGPLREALQAWIAQSEPRVPQDDEIMISAGNSQALSLIVALLAQPGSVVLVENPTYHLALRILRDAPVELVPVPCDESGMNMDALADIVQQLHAQQRQIAFVYTIPTFQNPTGASMSVERRQQLADIVARHQLLVVEDDVYRELWFDQPPLPSLWSTFPVGSVIRLGSFAKSLAPGLRVGFITADAALIARLSGCGLLDSGGGIAHFQSLLVAELLASGDYATIVADYRALYASRRDALHQALLPLQTQGFTWHYPAGGYFLWMRVPDHLSLADCMARIQAQQVDALPSTLFSQMPTGYAALRFAFSLYDETQLADAGQRIVRALT